MNTIKIAIFEDDPDNLAGMRSLIKYDKTLELTGAYYDCKDVIKEMQNTTPDIVLMDIDFYGEPRGLYALNEITAYNARTNGKIKVIMLSSYDQSELVFQCLCSGAWGYIKKHTRYDQVRDYIQLIYDGGAMFGPEIGVRIREMFTDHVPATNGNKLTPREKEVLSLLCEGLSQKLIADRMGITVDGVAMHLRHIFEKLNASSATDAVRIAFQSGIVQFKFNPPKPSASSKAK